MRSRFFAWAASMVATFVVAACVVWVVVFVEVASIAEEVADDVQSGELNGFVAVRRGGALLFGRLARMAYAIVLGVPMTVGGLVSAVAAGTARDHRSAWRRCAVNGFVTVGFVVMFALGLIRLLNRAGV